jgi:hypothetical protein
MATPKHPFLLWLLEDRLQQFEAHTKNPTGVHFGKGPFSYSIEKDIDRYREYQRQTLQQAQQSSQQTNSNTAEAPTGTHSSSASTMQIETTRAAADVILELPEDVLHPLIDATNARLFEYCRNFPKVKLTLPQLRSTDVKPSADAVDAPLALSGSEQQQASGVTDAVRAEVCGDVMAGKYFKPSERTVMVHMWTHVYLGKRNYTCDYSPCHGCNTGLCSSSYTMLLN